MALKLTRPLATPPWFTFFADALESLLNRLDRTRINFLRADFDKSHAGTTISLGAIPMNAVIIKPMSGVSVHEVFNAGTNNRLDIGTAATTDLYGTDLALTALGFVPLDENVSFRPSQTVATEIKIVVDVTGAAATTGKATAVIAYIVSQEA